MSGKSATAVSTSERDSWGRVFWFLALGGTIVMLSYEYLWSRFALRNLATTSFGAWFWTSLAITTPWTFCLICVRELREAVKNGKIDRDVCSEISVWVELAMIAAYLFLAPAIHRLPSLGALK
jgi:hypothetical protein